MLEELIKTGFDSKKAWLWEIYTDKKGRYRWRASDDKLKVRERSDGGFDTEIDCIDDTRKAGMDGDYNAPPDA